MRRARVAMMALLLLATLLVPAWPAVAWNQVTHRQINLEAVRLFMRRYAASGEAKYQHGRIMPEGYSEPLRGIAVTSSSLLVEPYSPPKWTGSLGLLHLNGYTLGIDAMPLDAWISAGGDWADEPHLYASVRHFYDPLARWGQAYLTDQYEYHGWYDDPQIDARTWALSHPDNPFNWQQALLHYKAALELDDEGWSPSSSLAPQHFKTAIDLQPLSAADERRIHLALAYRALGETMHLLGDMVQPAHVRNDSHPIDEPIEANTFSATVRRHAQKPVDAAIAPYLASAGGALQTPEELFRQVALFVNGHFYTADTIYDGPSNVIPANTSAADFISGARPPYDSPQFKGLLLREVNVNTWRGVRTVKRYNADIAGNEVPLAEERLSWVWFAGDLLPDAQGATTGWSLRPFQVPPSFADQQAEVLLPIAIHAGADLMHLFYPTLRLSAEFEDLREQEHSPSVINISAQMTHLVDEDIAWREQGLTIAYTGPARLEMTAAGKAPAVRKLHFVNGQLARSETHLGEMAEGPLVVYVAAPGTTMPAAEAFYRAEPGTQLQLIIEAGSRTFASDPYLIAPEEPTVTIQPPRLLLLELQAGASEAEHELSAYALPEGVYAYAWDFGDGESARNQPAPGESSDVSHTYRNLKAGDELQPTVTLYSVEGELLAEDSITIRVEGQAAEPLDWDCGWPVDYAVLHRSEGPTFIAYHDANGNAHGPWLTWRDASREVLKMAGCYYENKEHGRWTEYYQNGVVMMETDYKNGVKHGLWIRYNPDGVKVSEYTRQDGRDNGPVRKWHDNGQLSSEGFYTDDEPSGIWRYYNEDGSCSSGKNWNTGESLPCP